MDPGTTTRLAPSGKEPRALTRILSPRGTRGRNDNPFWGRHHHVHTGGHSPGTPQPVSHRIAGTPTPSPTPSPTPVATPSSDPSVVFANQNSTQWETASISPPFTAPSFASNGGLVITTNDPANGFGFWQTRNLLTAPAAGRYRVRITLAGTSIAAGKRHPEIRARVFRGDNRLSCMGLVAETTSGQGYLSPIDIDWTSDGTTPWRVAIDMLSFASDVAGGVTVSSITNTPIN